MSYKPYVRKEEYTEIYNGSVIPDEELEKALRQACRHIDSLTFNRIVAAGFDHLTAFQQETIKKLSACRQISNMRMQMKSIRFYPTIA